MGHPKTKNERRNNPPAKTAVTAINAAIYLSYSTNNPSGAFLRLGCDKSNVSRFRVFRAENGDFLESIFVPETHFEVRLARVLFHREDCPECNARELRPKFIVYFLGFKKCDRQGLYEPIIAQ